MKNKHSRKIINLPILLLYLKEYRAKLILVFLSLIITSSMILFLGRIIKYLVDGKYNNFEIILISMISVLILAIAGYFRSYFVNSIGENIVNNLRIDSYKNIINLPISHFNKLKVGDIISRLTLDTNIIYNIISNSVSFALRNMILLFGSFIALFFISAKLAMLILIIIPLSVLPILIIGKKIKFFSKEIQTSISNISHQIEESINGIKTIKSYLTEKESEEEFNKISNNINQISLKRIKIRSFFVSLIIIMSFFVISTIFLSGIYEINKGNITIGDLSSFIFYSLVTVTSVIALGQVSTQLQTADISFERILELINSKTNKKNINKSILNKKENLCIEFCNVYFQYKKLNKKILKNFNLHVRHGEKLAIVGESGIGKTTIIELLLRFYEPNSGEIKINNQNIKKISLNELRELFSYVSQDYFIFSKTIYENISYNNTKISFSEVEKFINQHKFLNFINNLPDKLNTIIDLKGRNLSNGERQRIALARAILRNSPILILDEVTSAVDSNIGESIVDMIDNISQDKIVIAIAHKFSFVAKFNRIIFLNNGSISEEGNHNELLKMNGFYARMYKNDNHVL